MKHLKTYENFANNIANRFKEEFSDYKVLTFTGNFNFSVDVNLIINSSFHIKNSLNINYSGHFSHKYSIHGNIVLEEDVNKEFVIEYKLKENVSNIYDVPKYIMDDVIQKNKDIIEKYIPYIESEELGII